MGCVADSDLDFLAGPPLEVAPMLLGAVLRHDEVAVRITEVEAYDGENDPGSHAFRGPTKRNAVMFGPPGHLYTYFIYGMHVCANIVCGPDGVAGAVLVRAGEVIDGVDLARTRRPAGPERMLAQGPGRLCSALGIGLEAYGTDLTRGPVRLERGTTDPDDVSHGPRVGLREAADLPWRFWITGDPTVSPYRPAAPRRRRGTAGRTKDDTE
jgi:DNA-3-methyladenine glycosylase